jgi:hypothetical protein
MGSPMDPFRFVLIAVAGWINANCRSSITFAILNKMKMRTEAHLTR